MSQANPMCIKYNSYKVEFALRGAGHIHGVLWVDWDNFSGLDIEKVKIVKDAFEKIRNEEPISEKHKQCISEFADLFIKCTLKDPKTKAIVEEVQMHHHTKACTKYCPKCRFYYPRFPSLKTIVSVPFNQLEGKSKEEQLECLEKSIANLKKVKDVLEDNELMEVLKKVGQEEIDNFINLREAIMLLENLMNYDKKGKQEIIEITDLIQIQIRKYTSFRSVTLASSKCDLKKMLTEIKQAHDLFGIDNIEEIRLRALLEKAGIIPEANNTILQVYEKALGVSKNGYKIIHKRDINEIYVNNYNPEWIFNWNANMDLQLCLDYYAVITYISDYYSKDDSGTMGHIKEALNKAGNESLQAKLSLVIH